MYSGRELASRFFEPVHVELVTAVALAWRPYMYLYDQVRERAAAGRPVPVGLIGSGKFGSMFMSQAPSSGRARGGRDRGSRSGPRANFCRTVGWSVERIAGTRFTADAVEAIGEGGVDVVVEATGDPAAGIAHARAAFAAGRHIVMVNVEADVLVGQFFDDSYGLNLANKRPLRRRHPPGADSSTAPN